MLSEAEETGAAVLFPDPMHQIHNNENGYMWQLRGAEGTAQIPSNSGRRRLNIIGAINPHTLTPTTLLIEGSCDKEVIIAFLELIKQDYPQTRSITVVLDNAAYNRAYDVVEKAEQLGITLKYLPPYSPTSTSLNGCGNSSKRKSLKTLIIQRLMSSIKPLSISSNTLTNIMANWHPCSPLTSRLLKQISIIVGQIRSDLLFNCIVFWG